MKNLKFGIVALTLLSITSVNAQEEGKQRPTSEERFAKMDANADEKISKEEFISAKEAADAKRAERMNNHQPMDTDKKFGKLDANSDGKIDQAEFDAARKDHPNHGDEHQPKQNGKSRFEKMDANSDGSITKDEMEAHKVAMEAKHQERVEKFENREPKDAEKIFSKIDANKDGSIDKTEFENARNKKGKNEAPKNGKAVK